MTEIKSNVPPYKRKCRNWLETYYNWIRPRSEAPDHFIRWSGIFWLASALRRKVLIPKSVLGTWECYPYMYIMLVGPPGMRKTTAAKVGEAFADANPQMVSAPTFITQTALVDQIVNSPDSSCYLLIEEFGDVIIKGGFEMYEFLTSMFDGKRKLEQKTMKRGVEFATAPCLNMLAATTPSWIADNMPAAVIGGGFASRAIWLYADKLPMRSMYWGRKTKALGLDFKKMEEDLIADLTHISTEIEGEFSIPEDVELWMENWYQNVHVPQENKASEKTSGFMRRKPVHIHKLAMLLHLSYSDDLVLTQADFEVAIMMLNEVQEDLHEIFGGIGKNKYSMDMKSIVRYVEDAGRVSREDLLRQFTSVATPMILGELITGCVQSGNLDVEYVGAEAYFTVPKPEDEDE